jgi:hypothetical protein
VEAGVRWAGRGVRGIDTCFFYPLANTEVIDIRDHEAVCQRLLRLRGGGGGGGGEGGAAGGEEEGCEVV